MMASSIVSIPNVLGNKTLQKAWCQAFEFSRSVQIND